MTSSTSGSELRRRPASAGACLAWFALSCAALLGASLSARVMHRWPEPQPIAPITREPHDPDYYLASKRMGLDQYAAYHGFFGIPGHLQRADVLFLGNSHAMFGFRREALGPFFEARHMAYYQMAFGYNEGSTFALDLIRKYDLHPKWVVLNVDWFFNRLSPMAERAEGDSRFEAVKVRVETVGAYYGERYVHRLVPVLSPLHVNDGAIYFRSARDGTLVVGADPHLHLPITRKEALPVTPAMLAPWSGPFKREMEARGIRLVVTATPVSDPQIARDMAAALGVPAIIPDPPGLYTMDGSHLELPSAITFDRAFLAEFAKLLDEAK